MKIVDPTIEELRAFLREHYARLLDEETLNTDGEIAIYYFAVHNHSGQWSNLYGAMCQSHYKPGPFSIIADKGDCVIDIYVDLFYHYFGEIPQGF